MEDSDIITLFWNRDEDAITVTNKKYGKKFKKIAFNILGNNEDAEECLNSAYFKTWNSIPPKRPEALSAYVGKIVRNLAFNVLEKRNAQKRGNDQVVISLEELEECVPSSSFINEQDESEFIEILNEYLGKLKPEKRQIFVCRYWAMMSIKDISVKYHISESRVKTMLFRLRNDFKQELDKKGIRL